MKIVFMVGNIVHWITPYAALEDVQEGWVGMVTGPLRRRPRRRICIRRWPYRLILR